jgi:hypothetical protein
MVLLEAGDFLSGSNNPFKNISMINLALLFHNTVFSSWHKEKKELVLSLKSNNCLLSFFKSILNEPDARSLFWGKIL